MFNIGKFSLEME